MKQAPKDWRAAAFVLERSWQNEYGRAIRVEQIGEKPEEPKTVGVNIFYDTGGKGIDRLLNFPVHPSMMEREREANMPGENAAETDNGEVTDAPENAISDTPPPQAVDKHLTGRIPPEWKNRTANSS